MKSIGLSQIAWLLFLLAPIIGGEIVGLLSSRVSEETKGHGVPEVLESVALKDGKMNLRVPFIKISTRNYGEFFDNFSTKSTDYNIMFPLDLKIKIKG